MKKKHFNEGRKIRKVTRLPNFILRIYGKRTAKKSPSSADAFVDKCISRCSSFENREVLIAEELLHDIRCEGATLLAGIRKNSDSISSTPDTSVPPEANPIVKRAKARSAEAKSSAESAKTASVRRLCEINEIIINVNLALDERIKKTRNYCLEKLHVFIMGVRSGGLRDYSYKPGFPNEAVDSYYEKHEKEDAAIRSCVEQIYNSFINKEV